MKLLSNITVTLDKKDSDIHSWTQKVETVTEKPHTQYAFPFLPARKKPLNLLLLKQKFEYLCLMLSECTSLNVCLNFINHYYLLYSRLDIVTESMVQNTVLTGGKAL